MKPGEFLAWDESPTMVSAARRTVVGALLLILILLASIAAFNHQVDPRQVNRKNALAPPVILDRDVKIHQLAQQGHFDFAILGTSRVQRFDPALIEKATGKKGYNAGLVGTSVTQAWETAEIFYLPKHRKAGSPTHIVYGFAPESIEGLGRTPNIPSSTTPLKAWIQFGTLKESIQVLHSRMNRKRDRQRTIEKANNSVRDDGYVKRGPFFDVNGYAARNDLEQQIAKAYRRYFLNLKKSGLDTDVQSTLAGIEKLLQVARREGDAPTIVLLPMQPKLAKQLKELGRDKFIAAIEQGLSDLAKRYEFTLLDYQDVRDFHGGSDDFYDGVHPRTKLADAMSRALVDDDPRLG